MISVGLVRVAGRTARTSIVVIRVIWRIGLVPISWRAIIRRTKNLVGELYVRHSWRAIRRLVVWRKCLPFDGGSVRTGRAMLR